MTNTSRVAAPNEPNAADSFESLRAGANRHVALVQQYERGQPDAHTDLVALITATAAAASDTLATLRSTWPTTPAGKEALARDIPRQEDLERAHRELLAALEKDCGERCAVHST